MKTSALLYIRYKYFVTIFLPPFKFIQASVSPLFMFFSRAGILSSCYRLRSWWSLHNETCSLPLTPQAQVQVHLFGVTVEHSPPGDANIQTELTSSEYCAYRSLGGSVEAQVLGWSLRLYISNKLPGDVHTTGLQSIWWVARMCGVWILVLAKEDFAQNYKTILSCIFSNTLYNFLEIINPPGFSFF